jgi:DNA polymerase III subunit gamma/tau
MSDSLLTRYRPASFDEVLGQDAVVASLRSAIEKKRGRAFLFTGPSGTGKTTLARIAAAALGCKLDDLTEVDAATQTGIDDMRAVASGLLYRPLGEGAVKAIIVDEVHALSKAAMTSLLKIMEDPPAWAYWFLCTTEALKVPETIKTRCLKYDLKPVGRADLRALLDFIDEQEKTKVEGSILDLCVHEANGSPRQAIANLGVCSTCTTRAEAADLLRSAAASTTAVELARVLVRGAGWNEVQKLLADLGDVSPESVRHVVRGYVTKVVLSAKSEKAAGKGIEILDAFSEPFHSSDGITPVLVACGRCLLGADEEPF